MRAALLVLALAVLPGLALAQTSPPQPFSNQGSSGSGGGGGAPSGAAGGDLAGSYPDPTVAADAVALGTDTTGGYAGSSTEGGPATTATALAANGANCAASSFPLGVDASGAVESCSTSISGNAATATALAANGANCSAGSYPLGVDASGAAEGCTVAGGGGGSPGGSDTQVQFNDSSAFGGDAGMTYNKTTDALTLAGLLTATGVVAAGTGTNAAGQTQIGPGSVAASGSATFTSVAIGKNASASTSGNGGVAIGGGATVTEDNGVAIGNASAAAGAGVALGTSANASGSGGPVAIRGIAAGASAVSVGNTSTAAGDHAVAVGQLAAADFSACVSLGVLSTCTAANQFVSGADGWPKSDVYFGDGVTSTTPPAYTIHGTGGSGSNVAGAAVNLAGGIGTGTGVGGAVNIQVAAAGSTGSSPNTLATVLSVTQAGVIQITPKATAPATCTAATDLYTDTSGALCFCTAANTWTNVSGVGACT